MSSDNFERKLRDKFANAQITPRPEVWQNIELGMANDKKSRRGGFFWIFGGSIFALGVIFLFIQSQYPVLGKEEINEKKLSVSIQIPAESPCAEEDMLLAEICPDESLDQTTHSNPSQDSDLNPQPVLLASTKLTQKSESKSINVKRDISKQISSNQFVQNQSNSDNHHSINKPVSSLPARSEELRINSKVSKNQLNQKLENNQNKQSDHLNDIFSTKTNPIFRSSNSIKKARNMDFSGNLSFPTYQLDGKITENDPPLELLTLPRANRWGFYGYAISSYGFRQNQIPFASVFSDNLSADFVTLNTRNTSANNPLSGQYQALRFPKWSTSVGFGAEYFLNRRFSIQSGLGLTITESGFFQESSLDFSAGVPSSGPIIIDQESLSVTGVQGFRAAQVELPLYFNYYLRKNRKALVFSIGGAINRNATFGGDYKVEKSSLEELFDNSNYSSTLPTPQAELLVYKKYNAYIAGRIHYQYALNPNFHFYIGPNFQTQISKTYDGEGAEKQFPHRIGLEIGFKWRKF